ncbi:MAG: STAS domain-containing protein [Actinobacteria bacterium]|nr:STAS domain-containing protein [Actinomycetota bacterium]
MNDCKISAYEKDGKLFMEIAGDADVYTAPKLKSRIIDSIDESHKHFVFDLRKTDFMDSSGLGVLVGALKRVQKLEGSVALMYGRDTHIAKVLRVTGLGKVFPVHTGQGT